MEARNDFYLREAEEKDCDLLFQWANDPVVRRNAFQTAQIPYERHVEWFHNVLKDDTIRQYILYNKMVPIGQIRLNIEDGTGLISYSIAPDMRGQGFGSRMLMLVKEKLEKEKLEKEKPDKGRLEKEKLEKSEKEKLEKEEPEKEKSEEEKPVKMKKKIGDVTKLMGQVKYENTASIKAFERCGYIRTEKEKYIEFELDLT